MKYTGNCRLELDDFRPFSVMPCRMKKRGKGGRVTVVSLRSTTGYYPSSITR